MNQLSADTPDLSDVRREVERIRREAAEQFRVANAVDEPTASMHATLSNLIMLVSEPCEKAISMQIDTVIDRLAVHHPSRFFIIRCSSSCAVELSAKVRSRCVKASSGATICTEEIHLDVAPQSADVVPNFLLSLLVPDIETALLLLDSDQLCRGGFAPLMERFATMVDVVMYDSASFAEYSKGIEHILSLLSVAPASGFGGAIARDMAWLRIKRWQELLMEQFRAQQFVSNLGCVQHVALEQRTPKGAPESIYPESMLLASWLLECLGWSALALRQEGEHTQTYQCQDAQKAPRTLSIQSGEEASSGHLLDAERIVALEVEVGAGEGTMSIRIERDSATDTAEVAVSVTAEGSGALSSCDYSVRRVAFRLPEYSEIVSSRIGNQRVHKQRERCVHIAHSLAQLALQ